MKQFVQAILADLAEDLFFQKTLNWTIPIGTVTHLHDEVIIEISTAQCHEAQIFVWVDQDMLDLWNVAQ